MKDKAIEARRAYKREWARNHPDKIRAQRERYWEKKAAEDENVSENHRKHGYQSPASEEEIGRRKSEMKTQGRKGVKIDRINMAFTPENYAFIRIASRLHGKTMTEFTNRIISAYRNEHQNVAEIVQALIDDVEGLGMQWEDEDDSTR